MAKKSPSILALLAGFAAGAAAVFFSKKENRQKAQKVVTKASVTANKMKAEYKKNPTAFKKKVKAEGTKLAKKVVSQASTTAKKATKVVKKKVAAAKSKAKKK